MNNPWGSKCAPKEREREREGGREGERERERENVCIPHGNFRCFD